RCTRPAHREQPLAPGADRRAPSRSPRVSPCWRARSVAALSLAAANLDLRHLGKLRARSRSWGVGRPVPFSLPGPVALAPDPVSGLAGPPPFLGENEAVAPVDLTAFCPPLPPRCPSGHLLRFGGREGGELMPGAFLMGWHSCGCE